MPNTPLSSPQSSSTPLPDPRYPIGPAPRTRFLMPEQRRSLIRQLAALPAELAAVLGGLPETALDTPYREGGWTVRQVVHHLADAHLHGYIRTKLALTEKRPTVTNLEENVWVTLPDTRLPAAPSLDMLRGIHARWAAQLEAFTPADWERVFLHPQKGAVSIAQNVLYFDWHGRHHTAQIQALRQRMSL